MLARSGGSAELKRIANFSVTHKVWGAVRWLEPVDVRSLPLKDVVIIAKSNVSVSAACCNHVKIFTCCLTPLFQYAFMLRNAAAVDLRPLAMYHACVQDFQFAWLVSTICKLSCAI